MPNEDKTEKPLSPDEQRALDERGRQNGFIPIMAGEFRSMIHRYAHVYGCRYEIAAWSLFSAMITAIESAPPEQQLKLMQNMAASMHKKIKAYAGEPPEPAPAADEAKAAE